MTGMAHHTLHLPPFPPPSPQRLAVYLTPAAERAARRGHPWLFDGGIRQIKGEGRPGDLAVLFDRKRRFLAIGLYDPDSPIRVKLLQHGQPAPIDAGWFQAKINAAITRRDSLLTEETTGCRLIHGENDGLPGLVLDKYGETAVLKLYTAAWLPHLAVVAAAIVTAVTPERLVLRLSRNMLADPARLQGLSDGHLLYGRPLNGPVLFRENGLTFAVDVRRGHKTGFFLDQRENRAIVGTLAEGRRALDVFAYTGGFSLYAARGGAPLAVSVDASRPALETAAEQFHLNRTIPQVAAARHETICGDAFAILAEMANAGRQFDLVVIDPPALAKSQAEVGRALAAYRQLVRLGAAVAAPEGILVISSCSSRVAAEPFLDLVKETAREAGRPLQELARTGHAADHPITFPEGAYLKCLFGRLTGRPAG